MTRPFTEVNHLESILRALVYIETNLDESLSLKEISRIARISPYYFHRLFTAYVSMPPIEYIRHLRLTQSAKFLQYSDFSITDIAIASGYRNLSSFTKAFSQLIGKSPKAYRIAMLDHLSNIDKNLFKKEIPNPQYIYRQEETVFYLRKVGDYKSTVWKAIRESQQVFAKRNGIEKIQRCYGMALDDPLIMSRNKCRFDLCIVLSPHLPIPQTWGEKKLSGGKYAVFSHYGPFNQLEETITHFFYHWHKSYKHKLQCRGSFCEYIDLLPDVNFFPEQKISVKYYVPLFD